MSATDVSRRQFVVGTAAALVSAARVGGQQPSLTAQVVADRIRAAVGAPWREKTIDGFKTGAPATVVTGVATTVMATLDVFRRASTAGQNFIISGPTRCQSASIAR